MPLGQLTHLPPSLGRNPFHPLLVKFSRFKYGSAEWMFTAEKYLLRYAWLFLLLMFGVLYLPLESIPIVGHAQRLATLIYPMFFLWSLTRLAGVELMQLMLEGQWTAEMLALPLSNKAWMDGFVTPMWIVFRQYLLITIFSLLLYGLETIPIRIVSNDGEVLYFWDFYFKTMGSIISMFFNAVLWIAFIYLARLYTEIRLRNGLLKGLSTVVLFLGGAGICAAYGLLYFGFHFWRHSKRVTLIVMIINGVLLLAGLLLHRKLAAHFRDYLGTQLDIDTIIYDDNDPHMSAWTAVVDDSGARETGSAFST